MTQNVKALKMTDYSDKYYTQFISADNAFKTFSGAFARSEEMRGPHTRLLGT